MKISGIRSSIVALPADEPLAGAAENPNGKRPIVTLEVQTDDGAVGVGATYFGGALTGPPFWLGIPMMALWGVAGAATQALMTQLVAPDQQGQLQGATTSVQSVSQLVGPFLFTLTFAYFIGAQAPLKLPGAPFLLASVLLVLALAIATRTLAGMKSGR